MLIYLIVNRLNGKLYVGKTTLSLAARRWSHIAHANHNYNKKQVISLCAMRVERLPGGIHENAILCAAFSCES